MPERESFGTYVGLCAALVLYRGAADEYTCTKVGCVKASESHHRGYTQAVFELIMQFYKDYKLHLAIMKKCTLGHVLFLTQAMLLPLVCHGNYTLNLQILAELQN